MRPALASLLLAAACGVSGPSGRTAAPPTDARPRAEAEPDASPTAVPTAPGPYEVVAEGPAGTVLGTVTLASLPPRAAVAPVPGPAACPGSVAMPAVAVGPSGGVAGAFVWLEDVARGKAFAEGPAELEVDACALRPRAVVVAPGGTLAVRNDDPVRHEVQLAPAGTLEAPALDGAAPLATWPMPLEGQRFARTLAEPGLLVVHADGAPRPRALVLVPRHPYVAVTDGEGRYRLDGVPPGKYTVRAWHPPLDARPLGAHAPATVVADGAVEVNVALAP